MIVNLLFANLEIGGEMAGGEVSSIQMKAFAEKINL